MLTFTLRRLGWAIPTLLVIALALFALIDLAPGDPLAQLPLGVSPEVEAEMRAALGIDRPAPDRFGLWLQQMFWIEPAQAVNALFGTGWAEDMPRLISWQNRAPVMQIIGERLPQTLWVVGAAYVVGLLLAVPLGIISALRQYSLFDHLTGGISVLGYALPPFFTGAVLILLFTTTLGWLPLSYDGLHRVEDWPSLRFQLWQMTLPVMVLSLQTTALLSRYMRAAMRDELRAPYVLSARARGLSEPRVILLHALPRALGPVVSVAALGLPQVFGGAIITEQIFRVNGVGHLLITALKASDWPVVLTITFLLAVLIVLCNLLADLLNAWLDPKLRHG
ncbi:ABC transporter permease [Roseovarius sp. CH_XMU1461]|uniref:ABC transporter permease n=1 Tax=Roseovarius sp. CH_XMU1461 TaxID=3107777 RepID=UPI00300A8C7E